MFERIRPNEGSDDLDLSKPFNPDQEGHEDAVEISDADRAKLAESIAKVQEEHVLFHIEDFLRKCEAGGVLKIGESVARYGFGEGVLNGLLISESVKILGNLDAVVSEMNKALMSRYKAGEGLNQEDKNQLAKDITEIIHNIAK